MTTKKRRSAIRPLSVRLSEAMIRVLDCAVRLGVANKGAPTPFDIDRYDRRRDALERAALRYEALYAKAAKEHGDGDEC